MFEEIAHCAPKAKSLHSRKRVQNFQRLLCSWREKRLSTNSSQLSAVKTKFRTKNWRTVNRARSLVIPDLQLMLYILWTIFLIKTHRDTTAKHNSRCTLKFSVSKSSAGFCGEPLLGGFVWWPECCPLGNRSLLDRHGNSGFIWWSSSLPRIHTHTHKQAVTQILRNRPIVYILNQLRMQLSAPRPEQVFMRSAERMSMARRWFILEQFRLRVAFIIRSP